MRNVVVLVADSLRYDSVPERIVDKAESKVIPTLAPSLHTPTSFASLFTALPAEKHNVRDFIQDLEPGIETADSRFENASFWDGPASALENHVLQSDGEDIDEMEEPFLWVERCMDTHLPYGELGHMQDYEFEESGEKYIRRLIQEGRLVEEYQKGVDSLEEHFFSHIDDLEERGLLEDTLVILTSDHGELLGERYLWKRRYEHNYPPIRNLVEVPTVFYNSEADAEAMRLIDVLPTALSIVGKETFGDGVDVREEEVREGTNLMEDVKASFHTRWRFQGEHWEPSLGSRLQIAAKTLIGDVKRFGYRQGYSRLEERLEERRENEIEGVEV